ncbi:cytochrome c oxidase assembly protein [Sphingosinicella sp. CPCC 101087]|uniref:cytochrome c oxidase assembly protein n=1 Tax=Sphingosinicella sp. CPCC 101087 TaxID=2497754 RepID=UPI00101C6A23|nr:cytochrome c oxidase assembly protein [Sphingosinicella sp. CPCC 101087]
MPAGTIWTPYCGAAPLPAELWQRWNLDPLLLAVLLAAAAGYALSTRTWARSRRMRFAAATALLLVLFVSPFCALTSALFSARVVHHVLLVTIVAPLLVRSFPLAARPGARSVLAATTAAQAIVFWLWHAPPVYGWALSSDAAYWLMQASLLAAAAAFWAAIRRASAPAASAALLATMVQMGLLGALITFAPRALYAPHFAATAGWGYSPLEDQQLAGLIMWAPAAALYLGAALLLLARMIGPDPERARAG